MDVENDDRWKCMYEQHSRLGFGGMGESMLSLWGMGVIFGGAESSTSMTA